MVKIVRLGNNLKAQWLTDDIVHISQDKVLGNVIPILANWRRSSGWVREKRSDGWLGGTKDFKDFESWKKEVKRQWKVDVHKMAKYCKACGKPMKEDINDEEYIEEKETVRSPFPYDAHPPEDKKSADKYCSKCGKPIK